MCTIDFLFGYSLANVSIVLSLTFIIFEIKKIIYVSRFVKTQGRALCKWEAATQISRVFVLVWPRE